MAKPYLLTAPPDDIITLASLSCDVFMDEMDKLDFKTQCIVMVALLEADGRWANPELSLTYPQYFSRWTYLNREKIREFMTLKGDGLMDRPTPEASIKAWHRLAAACKGIVTTRRTGTPHNRKNVDRKNQVKSGSVAFTAITPKRLGVSLHQNSCGEGYDPAERAAFNLTNTNLQWVVNPPLTPLGANPRELRSWLLWRKLSF